MKEEQLIFIISQPRSGSTYLQNILSNNSSVNTVSEPWLLLNFASILKPELTEAVFDEELTNEALKEYRVHLPEDYFNETFKKFILELYEPLLKGHQYFIDKTPRYWEIVDEIVTLFPKAKVLVIFRNPVNVVNSMIRTWDLNTLNSLHQFKRDLIFAPLKLYEFVNRNKDNLNVRSIRYEDLATDKEKEIISLYEWLEIPYDSTVLDTESNHKFRGAFGDPFQNSKDDYIQTKNEAKKTPIDSKLKEFSQGYSNYLNDDFLKEFDYLKDMPTCKKTMAFRYFMSLNPNNIEKESLKRKMIRTILSKFYS